MALEPVSTAFKKGFNQNLISQVQPEFQRRLKWGRTRLLNIRKGLLQWYQIKQNTNKRTNVFGYFYQYQGLNDKNKDNERAKIERLSIEAYLLLQQLIAIMLGKVRTTFTLAFSKDNKFYYIPNVKITAQYLNFSGNEIKLAQSLYSDVQKNFDNLIKNNEQQLNNQRKLTQHYENFVSIYAKWVDQRQNKNYPWTYNQGRGTQAFVEHLVQAHNDLRSPQDYNFQDDPSPGYRWQLYRKNTESVRFDKGGDVGYRQVKADSASLTNVSTILNAIDQFLFWTDGKSKQFKTMEDFSNAYDDSQVIQSIDEQMYKQILRGSKEELQQFLKSTVASAGTGITLQLTSKQKNDKGKSQTIINKKVTYEDIMLDFQMSS